MGLEQIIEGLRAMREPMIEMGNHDSIWEVSEIETFIKQASRKECKHIIDALIDRVSTLDGLAPELEDASYSLARSIEVDGD